MKTTLVSIFIVLNTFPLFAQISCNVLSEKGEVVEFATVYDISKQTSCITNINGNFFLQGKVGDSIEIRHLNYQTKRFEIKNQNEIYILIPKKFQINEILISAKAAAFLFEKSCRNTYAKFKDFDVTRGYCRYLRINDKDTTQLIDIDFDVIHKKKKRFETGRNTSPVLVQERIIKNDSLFLEDLSPNIADFYPHINAINWVKISEDFNYYKVEDSLFICIYFLSKKQVWDLPYNYEVKIFKADTSLSSIIMTNKNTSKITNIYNTGDSLNAAIVASRSNYVKYNYEDEFSYLAEFSHQFELFYMGSDSIVKPITIELKYKTYNKDASNLERRFGYRVFNNRLVINDIENRYTSSFWKSVDYFTLPLVDYNRLLDLEFDNN